MHDFLDDENFPNYSTCIYLYLLFVFIEDFPGEAPPTNANIASNDPGAATQYNNSTNDQN